MWFRVLTQEIRAFKAHGWVSADKGSSGAGPGRTQPKNFKGGTLDIPAAHTRQLGPLPPSWKENVDFWFCMAFLPVFIGFSSRSVA